MSRVVAIVLALMVLVAWGEPSVAQAQETPVVAVQGSDEPPSLADLQWIARPIVVFADTPNDPRFIQQMRMLEEQPDELEVRDVVIMTDTDPEAEGPLREELRPRGFNLVLIDKDGSVAQRRPAPTTTRELIRLIDRMPSRRQETGSFRQ